MWVRDGQNLQELNKKFTKSKNFVDKTYAELYEGKFKCEKGG